VMVLIALLWIPVIRGQSGLYYYLQAVQGYLAPPIFAVFFLGVFFKRLNGKGALAALIVGFLLGIFRLAVDTPVLLSLSGFEKGYQPNSFLWIVNNIYFQYYSVLIFLVSSATMVAVSLATAPPALERLQGLTYGTVTRQQWQTSRASWGWGEVVASMLVLAGIAAAYLYFAGDTPLSVRLWVLVSVIVLLGGVEVVAIAVIAVFWRMVRGRSKKAEGVVEETKQAEEIER
jgi:solute:Na+ symporter, SSS family